MGLVRTLQVSLVYAFLMMAGFLCHKHLQKEYYRRCNNDIIQVLFFKNSSFCLMIHRVLYMIETGFQDVLATLFHTFLLK